MSPAPGTRADGGGPVAISGRLSGPPEQRLTAGSKWDPSFGNSCQPTGPSRGSASAPRDLVVTGVPPEALVRGEPLGGSREPRPSRPG